MADHQRVNISSLSISCGVMGLDRISGEDMGDVCYQIASRLYHPSRGSPCAAFIFSDVLRDRSEETTNSDLLAKFIAKHGFGEVSVSIPMENPKTGNIIEVFTWVVNHSIFKYWYSKTRVERLGKVGT